VKKFAHLRFCKYAVWTAEQVLAPGYKGRARFKFFAERCPHHNNNLRDFEQQLSPILVGRSVGRSVDLLFSHMQLLEASALDLHSA